MGVGCLVGVGNNCHIRDCVHIQSPTTVYIRKKKHLDEGPGKIVVLVQCESKQYPCFTPQWSDDKLIEMCVESLNSWIFHKLWG